MLEATLDQLYEDFSLLTDWEDRYRHIIELGRNLPTLTESERTPPNKVEGCMSQVWLVAQREGGKIIFKADSDAHIVKGLIAILLMAYSNKTPEQIRAVNIEQVFDRLGLGQHLSPVRRNGFFAMVGRIRALAA